MECDDNDVSVQKVAEGELDRKEKEEKLAKLKEWKVHVYRRVVYTIIYWYMCGNYSLLCYM